MNCLIYGVLTVIVDVIMWYKCSLISLIIFFELTMLPVEDLRAD